MQKFMFSLFNASANIEAVRLKCIMFFSSYLSVQRPVICLLSINTYFA